MGFARTAHMHLLLAWCSPNKLLVCTPAR
jgi:hypothetical protein